MKEDRIMMKKIGTAEIVGITTEIRRGSLPKAGKVQEKEIVRSQPAECICRKEETVVTTGRKGTVEEKDKARIGGMRAALRQAKGLSRCVVAGKATARRLDQRTH